MSTESKTTPAEIPAPHGEGLADAPCSLPTHKEARQSLKRFINSHFNRGEGEAARFSIPVDLNYDDDVRLSAYIDNAEAMRAALEKFTAEWEWMDGPEGWREEMAKLWDFAHGENDEL